jgi:hypothetical protein
MARIPAAESITRFIHCKRCIEELPPSTSPMDWARLSVGFTPQGIQVWCNRHEINVMHVDFEGVKHPANLQPRDG